MEIDLKNIHKIAGEMVDGIEQVEMEGKTPDEYAQERGFSTWMEYAAWSRHTGGDYQMMVYALKSKWKEQDPEEFARQKKIQDDQSLREHSYINLPPEAWPTSVPNKNDFASNFIGNKKKKWQPVHKSNFTAEQLEKVYDDFGVSGELVEYRW
jgi:hypothetical protein